jgi:hypothetical protein
MDQLSYSYFDGETVTVAYKNYIFIQLVFGAKPTKTNAHLRIYRTKADNEKEGCHKIFRSIVSHNSDEDASTFVKVVYCNGNDFKTTFLKYINSDYLS